MTRRQAVCLGGLAALSTAALGFAGRMNLARADAAGSASQGGAAETPADASSYLYAAFDNPFDGSGTCLWGFVDKTGVWVIKPQFEAVGGMPGDTVPLCLGSLGGSLSQRYADAMLCRARRFRGRPHARAGGRRHRRRG